MPWTRPIATRGASRRVAPTSTRRAAEGDLWIARPEDTGDPVEKKQPAPGEFKGERVPQYLPGSPTGSAADVEARGTWAGGKWVVEFARKLATGQADDTPFDRAKSYRMAVSVHDRTGEMDKASELIVLVFQK